MSKSWQITAVLVAILLWGLTMFAPALGFGGEIDENTAVPDWPGFELSRILDTTQTEEIEEFLDMTLPARPAVVKAKARIEMDLFRRSPNPDVLLGREGWLFLAQSLEFGCAGGDLAAMGARVDQLASAVERNGGRLAVAMIPNKITIYPGKVDFANTGKASCSAANRGPLVQALDSSGRYLDLMSPLLEAGRGPEFIYHANDTHWNDLGASIAAQTLIEVLTGSDTTGWFVRGEDRQHVGDLTKLLGLDDPIVAPQVRLARPDLTTRREIDSRVRYGRDSYFSESTVADAFTYRRVAVIHDSFGPFIKPYLVPLGARVDFFDSRNLDDQEMAESIDDADLVLVLIVERSWYRQFAEEFISDELLALLRD